MQISVTKPLFIPGATAAVPPTQPGQRQLHSDDSTPCDFSSACIGVDYKFCVRDFDDQALLEAMNEAPMNEGRGASSAHFSYITESRSVLPSGLWENAGSCALFVCPPLHGVPSRRLPAYKRFCEFVCVFWPQQVSLALQLLPSNSAYCSLNLASPSSIWTSVHEEHELYRESLRLTGIKCILVWGHCCEFHKSDIVSASLKWEDEKGHGGFPSLSKLDLSFVPCVASLLFWRVSATKERDLEALHVTMPSSFSARRC